MLADLGINLENVITEYSNIVTYYADRNDKLDDREDLFDGVHWEENVEAESGSAYQLVANYLRNVVLRFVAVLSKAPTVKVPLTGSSIDPISIALGKCERLLLTVWPELQKSWRDVEMNASKLSFGVFQVLWSPMAGQPEDGKYTKCPWKFRSINPRYFYPVWRTYDSPNDFVCVYRRDPGRVLSDVEEQYDVELQATDSNVVSEGTVEIVEKWTNKAYLLLALTRETRPGPRRNQYETYTCYYVLEAGKNPYGQVPFWILQNIRSNPNADPTYGGSISDLDDLGALVKHFEEILSEQAQEVATHIHSPLVYKSEDHLTDPQAIRFEPGAVFPIGAEEELEAIKWPSDTSGGPMHLDLISKLIQDMSFLGEAGFGRIPVGATGIGLKIALSPMEQILELKTPKRLEVLEQVATFILKSFKALAEKDSMLRTWTTESITSEYSGIDVTPEEVPPFPKVNVSFGNLLPRDEQLHEQNEVYKFKTGAQSLYTTLDKMGHTDPSSEIARIKEELNDPELNPEHVLRVAQAKQLAQQQEQQQPKQLPWQKGQPQPQQKQQQQMQLPGLQMPGGPGGMPMPGGMPGGGMPGGGQPGLPIGGPGMGGQPMLPGMNPMQQMMGAQPGMGQGFGGVGGVPGGMEGMGMGMQPGLGMQPGMMSGVGMPGAGPGTAPPVPPEMLGEQPAGGAGNLAPFLQRKKKRGS